MEKRKSEAEEPESKRVSLSSEGPLTADDVELFQKEAIYRQMNSYKRERDELVQQLDALNKGDDDVKEEFKNLTAKYVEACKKLDRMESATVQRVNLVDRTNNSENGDSPEVKNEQDAGATGSSSPEADKKSVDDSDSAKIKAANEKALKDAESEIKVLKDEINVITLEREKLTKRISELDEKLASNPISVNILEDKLKLSNSRTAQLGAQIDNLHKQIDEFKGVRADYEFKVRSSLEEKLHSLEKKWTAADADAKRLRQERDELLDQMNIQKAETAAKKNEIGKLKELIELDASNANATNTNTNTNTKAEESKVETNTNTTIPEDFEELKKFSTTLVRQKNALAEEISQLEIGFVNAKNKAKQALKEASESEQKMGVLNATKLRTDHKYFEAMRQKDLISSDLANCKRQLALSAQLLNDKKAIEQKLVTQLSSIQKQMVQCEQKVRDKQKECEKSSSQVRDIENMLNQSKASLSNLRRQLEETEKSKFELESRKRDSDIEIEKLKSQLDTQAKFAVSGSSSEIQEQIESLRSIAMCPVCQKNWKDTAISTCGHTLCNECVKSRLAARMRSCPMCNTHFSSADVLAIHL